MWRPLPLLLLLPLLLPPLLLLLAAAAQAAEVSKVHVLFMNHLDVGFASGHGEERPGLAATVLDIYFNEYFPKALEVAEAMRSTGDDRFVYTTKAWLVSLYLDCPTGMGFQCPSAEARQTFEAAIRRGDIQWHAFPFNTQAELMDASMVRFALQLSHDLDDRYGVVRKMVFSQRDVPGTTRTILPLLNDAGVRAVSFGVNGASAPLAVPSTFRWQSTDDDTGALLGEVLAFYHPGGYGGVRASDCHTVGEWDEALCLYFKNDNEGPPDVAETQGAYAAIRAAFPNATTVEASSFEAFVTAALQSGYVDALPVVDGEMGDTWIHIAGADPMRFAQVRAILTERAACEAEGVCDIADGRYYNFSRLFLKAFEHTFGEDVKTALDAQGDSPSPEYYMWTNAEFHANRDAERFRRLEASWDEQRAWDIDVPLEALQDHPLAARLRAILPDVLRGGAPSLEGFELVAAGVPLPDWAGARLTFDAGTGALVGLLNVATGVSYADASHAWGTAVYQTFDEAAFDDLLAQYMFCDYLNDCRWAYFDFGKVDLDAIAAPERRDWLPTLRALYRRVDVDANVLRVLAELDFPAEASLNYGAPAGGAWLEWTVPATPFDGAAPWNVAFTWLNKTATRLPEAFWLHFQPLRPAPQTPWRLVKLDAEIDASRILGNGSYHLHAVQRLRDPTLPATFASRDCPLITLGAPNPFPTPLVPVDPDTGFAFNLANTMWGTNTCMVVPYRDDERDATFRFTFTLGASSR